MTTHELVRAELAERSPHARPRPFWCTECVQSTRALAGQPGPKRLPHTTRKSVPPQSTRTKLPQVMSSPQPHGMNRYKTNQARHNQPERRPGCTHIPAGGGLTTRTLNPPPTQLHRPPRRPGHRPRQASEGPSQGQCTHVKAKTPLMRGNAVPEVGLELHSSPRKHWALTETCGIRPDPTPARASPTPKVLTLSTPTFIHPSALPKNRVPLRERGFLPDYGRVRPVLVVGGAAGHERSLQCKERTIQQSRNS